MKFKGLGKWAGIEVEIELTELCDDGSDPEHKIYITKENGSGSGTRFRQEANDCKLALKLAERCREILNIVKDEA